MILGKKTSLIIKKLDRAKTHGCDNISVKMIKICSESLTVPLKIIFEQSLKEGRFWKKANVVLLHKKEDKSILKNHRPISYFPFLVKFLKE